MPATGCAILLDHTNREAAARAQLDTALAIDPLALQIRNGLSNHYQWHGDYDTAIREYRATLQIDPNFANARWWLAVAYLEAGRVAEGLAALDSVPPTFAEDIEALRGWGYAQLGRRDEARIALAQVSPTSSSSAVTYIVRGYMPIGEPDTAFAKLRRALERREYPLLEIVLTPAGIRSGRTHVSTRS